MAQHNTIKHEQQNTLTIQNYSNPPDVTTNNQASLTLRADSKLLNILVRQIIEQDGNNQQPDDTSTK